MGNLHWIGFGPERSDLTRNVLRYATATDTLLFTGPGVLHLIQEDASPLVKVSQAMWYFAEGLPEAWLERIPHAIEAISEAQLVELTLKAQQTLTWHG